MSAREWFRRKVRPRDARGALACIELVELITGYLEGTLPPDDRARFDAHLGQCEGCRNYLEQMRLTIALVGHLSVEEMSPQEKQTLLQTFRNWNG
jgi:anti-sigma factor RsiW